ncbi:MAG: hypothetical protein KBC62_04490 [Candidatus Pacebacteria bacterium]|nr:hypothetical protein [Candidatus Paceibacterota bacterium]MBP9843232.1 hypothetical protein [Candidatus Paceibacterota bacterium]
MTRSTIRNLIITSVLLLVAVAAFFYSAYFLKTKELALQSQLATLQKEQQQESLYFRLEKLAIDSKDKREQLRTPLLDQESESIEVLTWIEGLAPQAGVSLETKNLQKISDKETKTDWIEIAFVFSGSQANVERFVNILEHMPYLSYMTSLNMSARPNATWEATATLRILLFKAS